MIPTNIYSSHGTRVTIIIVCLKNIYIEIFLDGINDDMHHMVHPIDDLSHGLL